MQEQQLQAIAERLASKRGLSAHSVGTIIDVPVDSEAVVEYVDTFYNYLTSVYDEALNISASLSLEEFRLVMLATLAKRIQWVRQRTNGIREGRTIQIANTTPLPGPVYRVIYAFGRVESTLGAVFLPSMDGFTQFADGLSVEVMRKYLAFVSKAKHYYAFSEGLPSQDRGTWAYLIHADMTTLGALLVSPSPESVPDDAYLASIVRCARTMAGFFYGNNHGLVQNPDIARVEFFDAYGKGIGDAS